MRKLLTHLLPLLLGVLTFYTSTAQTITNPIHVDFSGGTTNQTLTNVTPAWMTESASGMTGSCFTLPCCSVMVVKVTLPADGVLRVEMLNYTPLAGSIIAYYPNVANPTSFSDLSYITAAPGNFCGFRDTLELGRHYRDWNLTPLGQTPANTNPTLTSVYDFNAPSFQAGFFPAGDYYLLIFTENNQANISSNSTDITFEFAEACTKLSGPTDLNFTTVEPNAQTDTIGFYFNNNRQNDITFDSVYIAGVAASQYTVTSAVPAGINVGDSAYFEVVFAPNSGGPQNATLNFEFSDISCSTSNTVQLYGAGSLAELQVLVNGVQVANNDSTPTISEETDFGSLLAGQTSTSSFLLVNNGTDTLELNGNPTINLVGSNQFTILGTVPTLLLPGDTAHLQIEFAPIVDGISEATLTIANNTSTQNPFTFKIRGTATQQSLSFDGTNDYVNINTVASAFGTPTSFTLEAWIKPSTSQVGDDIIIGINGSGTSTRTQCNLFLDDGTLECFADGNNYSFPSGDLRDNQWHHVALAYDGTHFIAYLDGVLIGKIIGTIDPFTTADRWSIGQEYDGSSTGNFWVGNIDEVRIWNVLRTPSEIINNRYCVLNNTEPGLVANYTFNQGQVEGNNTGLTTLTDASTNASTGTLVNFALNGTSSNWVDGNILYTTCIAARVCDATSYTAPSGQVLTASGTYVDVVPNALGQDSTIFIDLAIQYTEVDLNVLNNDTLCLGESSSYSAPNNNYVQYLDFTQANEGYVNLNSLVDSLVNTDRSIFLWMKQSTTVAGDFQTLVAINSSGTATITNLLIDTDEDLDTYDGGSYQTTNTVVTDGIWHHVGYTYNEASNETKIYIDGIVKDTYTNGQSISATDRISLGQEFDGAVTSNFFEGQMSQIAFYNKALSDAEVQALFSSAPDSTEISEMLAFYPGHQICGGVGEFLEDVGPNGFHGIMTRTDIIQVDTIDTINGYNASNLYQNQWELNNAIVSTDSSYTFNPAGGGNNNFNLEITGSGVAFTDSFNTNAIEIAITLNTINNNELSTSVSGGIAPYTYAWSNGTTTASINNLLSGTYTVTITDRYGCTATASETVTAGPVITIAVDSNVSCTNFSDGGATASVSGGTAPYTYLWSNGATTASITGVMAGTYTVTVTDSTALTQSNSVTITQPAALNITSTNVAVSCNGDSNGSITNTITGGTMPYTYLWSNTATTQNLTNVSGGTYTITVTDNNGCTATLTDTILQPTALTVTALVDSNDYGNGGGLTANVSGGTMPYTYLWSNGATTASITGLSANSYTVTSTDANGCTTSASATITTGPSITLSIDSNVTCNGGADGGTSVSVTAGAAPFTYLWSNGATTASITGLTAGSYTVTVTDNNGGIATDSISISEPPVFVASLVIDSAILCNGANNAVLSAIAIDTLLFQGWENTIDSLGTSFTGSAINPGGNNNVVFESSTSNGRMRLNAGSTYNYAGNYALTLDVQSSGSTATNFVTLTEDLSSAAGGNNIDLSLWVMSHGDEPQANDKVWVRGDSTATWIAILDMASKNYNPGIYYYESFDLDSALYANSQQFSNTFQIRFGQQDNFTSVSIFASDGYTFDDILITGAQIGNTYAWNTGATTPTINNVAPGSYSVTVTNQFGCVDSDTIVVTEPTVLTISTITDSNVTCFGSSNGGGTALAAGGTMPYNYAWSNGATTASIANVSAGTYQVTATDANGCSIIDSIVITEPTALLGSTQTLQNVNCFGGNNASATVAASGGTSPYAFAWSNGSTNDTISGLQAGTYFVTITDAEGCTTLDSTIVTEPTALVVTATLGANESCSGASDGAATASATGGTGAISYLWNNAANTSTNSNLAAATYYVTATDSLGCTAIDSVVVATSDTVAPTILTQNATIYLDANGATSIDANTINNGTFDACGLDTFYLSQTQFICNSVGPNTIFFTAIDVNGNSDSSAVVITVLDTIAPTVLTQNVTVYLDANGSASITTADINNGSFDNCAINTITLDSTQFDCSEVGANTVTLTVTDVNGNANTATATVTVLDTIAPTVLTQNVAVYLDVNGSASITTTDINNGSFDNCSINTIALDSTQFDCSEVGANTVTLTVTDVNGNANTATATVTVLDTIAPTVLTQNVTVYLDAAGSASITTTNINNGSFDNCAINTIALDSTQFDCSEVGANTVTLTVTDVNGNANTATATVTVLDTISPTVLTQNVTVYLDAAGSASITTSDINNGSFDNCAINTITLDSTQFDCSEVGANTVTLTVTDVNGNSNTATATVTVLDTIAPEIQLPAAIQVCAYDSLGTYITYAFTSSDNCAVDTVVQSAGFPSGTHFPIGITWNVFTVTDVNGNQFTDSFMVEVYPFPMLEIDPIAIQCETNGTVALTAIPLGGTFSGNGVSGTTFNPSAVSVGVSTVTYTYTTNQGCTYSQNAYIDVKANPVVELGSFSDTVCIENEIVPCPVATPSGGVYSGPGINGVLLETYVAGLGVHTITYTYTDQFGCVGSDSTIASVQHCFEPSSVKEFTKNSGLISVFPNPNNGAFTLKNGYNKTVTVEVFNANGVVIATMNVNEGEQQVQLPKIAAGLYFIRAIGDSIYETHQVVIY